MLNHRGSAHGINMFDLLKHNTTKSAFVFILLFLISCGSYCQNNSLAPVADTSGTPQPENGLIGFGTPRGNGFIYMKVDIEVPYSAPTEGVAFIWPGLQPGGENYSPIDNGVLQPVLTHNATYGSCAPNQSDLPAGYKGWWISGQYVNTYGTEPGYTGCNGGSVLAVSSGDLLTLEIAYDSSLGWVQTVTNKTKSESVNYIIKLEVPAGFPQEQNRAFLVFEPAGGSSLPHPVTFRGIVLKTVGYNELTNDSHPQCSPIERVDDNTVSIASCLIRTNWD